MSTLARDVPFAGFQVTQKSLQISVLHLCGKERWFTDFVSFCQIMFYEAFRRAVEHSHVRWSQPGVVVSKREFNSLEELVLGGVAGGIIFTCISSIFGSSCLHVAPCPPNHLSKPY